MSGGNGGPAFPPSHWNNSTPSGMTLRQYYAAKAMQAYIAAHITSGTTTEEATFDKLVAKWSFETADSMLAAENLS